MIGRHLETSTGLKNCINTEKDRQSGTDSSDLPGMQFIIQYVLLKCNNSRSNRHRINTQDGGYPVLQNHTLKKRGWGRTCKYSENTNCLGYTTFSSPPPSQTRRITVRRQIKYLLTTQTGTVEIEEGQQYKILYFTGFIRRQIEYYFFSFNKNKVKYV